jgi:predicted dehydrogenase/nucleoside-diphosphate-sugar epimerase
VVRSGVLFLATTAVCRGSAGRPAELEIAWVGTLLTGCGDTGLDSEDGLVPLQRALRVGIVGCGAVAELHMAAIRAVPEVRATGMFDLEFERADKLRRRWWRSAKVVSSLEELANLADLAIVATPNAAHEEVACELLERGVHVLCEKPLAHSVKAAERMVQTARLADKVLACGHVRRFSSQFVLLREAMESEVLGEPTGVEVWECVKWYWSRSSFDPTLSGGGVLIDTGPHVIDLITQIIGPPELVDYSDDRMGGVEACASARFRCLRGDRSVPIQMFLARGEWGHSITRFICDRGIASIEPHEVDTVQVVLHGKEKPLETMLRRKGPNPYGAQLRNVVNAVIGRESLRVPGEEALAGMQLLEACYERRRFLIPSWTEPRVEVGDSAVRRLLLTGATGRIGSRLVEMWAESGRLGQLRCLVRGYRTAPRLMRYSVDVVEGDLRDPHAVRRAVQGCDAVVHLGAGENPRDETRNAAGAALAEGVKVFIHMSTAVVYGLRLPQRVEEFQEETALARTGEIYADGKASAELEIVRFVRRGLRAVILRPQVVYGPEMRWSAELLRLLVAGRLCVINGGGYCNIVYVDDLVRAVSLALSAECRPGSRFFITDGRPITWEDYINTHARLLGHTVPRCEWAGRRRRMGLGAAWRDTVRLAGPLIATREFRELVTEGPLLRATVFRAYLALRNRLPAVGSLAAALRRSSMESTKDGPTFDRHWMDLQLSEARLSGKRAEKELGYVARVSFRDGLRRTALWFERTGLAPARQGRRAD